MDPPQVSPGTTRWFVLYALAETELQSQWSAAQLAVHTGLALERVLKTLNWLRDRNLCELAVWMRLNSLYEITDAGRQALSTGAQLALDVP
jgi:hypothetical protein